MSRDNDTESRRLLRLPESATLRDVTADLLWPLATIASLLIVWELWVRLAHVPPYVIVPFSTVVQACIEDAGALLHHTRVTMLESVYGFALGAAVAVPLAFAIVSLRPVAKGVYPLVVIYHVIPVVAVAPLLSIWFGFGILPKILIVANFTFFPIMLNTIIGLRATERLHLRLFRSIGANWIQAFWRLRLPNALPQVFVGLKVASTLALIGAVVAEYVTASEGLGYYVLKANGNLDTEQLMSGVVYLAVAGTLLYVAMQLLERLATPWDVSRRSGGRAKRG